MAETTRPPLIFHATIAAPPEQVFGVIFEQPSRWLSRGGTVEGREGGALRLDWPEYRVTGRFVQYAPPRTGRFSWHMEGDPMPETMVVISVEPHTSRDGQPTSRVEVEHYGFGAGPDWEPLYLGAACAWAGYLKNLRSVVETGADLREDDE